MKNMKKYLYIAIAAILAAGCSSLMEQRNESPNEVRFSTNISSFATKSINPDAGFANGDAISVFAIEPFVVDNVKYTVDGNTLKSDTPIYWPEDLTEEAYFGAIYPYKPDMSLVDYSGLVFSVKTDQSTQENYHASDMLLAENEAKPGEVVDLEFHHFFTRVDITIDGELEKGISSVSLGGVSNSIDMNKYEIVGEKVPIKAGQILLADGTKAWSCIVVPERKVTPELIITFTDGTSATYPVSKAVDLQEGCRYRASLSLSEDGSLKAEFIFKIFDWLSGDWIWMEAVGDGDWQICANFTEWDASSAIPMEKIDDGIYQVEYQLPRDAEFKFICNWSWNRNLGGVDYEGAGVYRTPALSGDVTVELTADGYNLYYPNGGRVLITLNVNKEYATIEALDLNHVWSLIGTVEGTNWDTDLDMEQIAEGVWVRRWMPYHEGEEFKFRMDGSWEVNYGTGDEVYMQERIGYALVRNGCNIKIEQPGYYSVYINLNSMITYAAWEGAFETELDQIQDIVVSQDGTQVEFTSVVYAISGRGFVLYDGKYSIFVYTAEYPQCNVGDAVHVTGVKTTYNGVPEIGNTDLQYEVVAENQGVDTPYYYNITRDIDNQFADITIPVEMEGVVSYNGSEYLINVEGASNVGAAYWPIDDLGFDQLVNHMVHVCGFYNGTRGNKVYIVVTGVEDYGEVEVPEYSAQGDGSFENPFNATGAYTILSGYPDGAGLSGVYVHGIISSIKYTFSASYGTATFYISDDGSAQAPQFQIYGVYYFNNTPWAEGDVQIAVGDDVTIYGKITNYKGTPESANKEAWLYSLNGWTGPEVVDYSGWSLVGDIYGTAWDSDFALTASNDNPAVQYAYLDYVEGQQFKFRRNGAWEENYGLGDPGTVFTAASQAVYGLVESGGNIQLESSGTWLVAIDLENLLFSAQLIPEGGQTIEVRLSQEGLASLAAGGTPVTMADGALTITNSSNYGTTAVTEMRIYKSQTLTLSVPQGYAITDVEMTCTSSNPATGFGSGAPEGFADGVWRGNAQSLTFTAVDKQVRITAMTIKIAVL